MDEEFKVRFVVDMGDTEKRVKRLKNDLTSMESSEIHFKSNIGNIDKNANSIFKNIRNMMSSVEKNPIWSNAKKQEYIKFFKGMESTANRAFHNLENRYSKLAQDLSGWDFQKNALQLELNSKDYQAEKIRDEIQKEMSKKSQTLTYEDLAKMQEQYNKLTSMKTRYRQEAENALTQGNRPDYESWIRDIERIDQYQKKLMDDMQNFKVGESTGGPDYKKISRLREEYDKITKDAEELDKEITKMDQNTAMEKKRQEIETIRMEYRKLITDLQGNPLKDDLGSESFKTFIPQIENLNDGLDRSGSKIRWNTKLTESWGKMMDRLKSRVRFSIVSMLNPIRIIRKAWSGFLEQNVKTKNTLKMIGLNLQKVIAPLLQRIANFIFKMAQYANVLTKAWFNVDLFDQSVLSAQKTEKEIKKINQLTAGFDELNVFKEESNDENNSNEILGDLELPKVDTSKLKDWAENGFGKNIGGILNWALEHPVETAGIYLGTRLFGGLLSKGIGSWIGKGITKLFGGSEVATGAATGGSLIGNIFGKTLYTGISGTAVTVGKLLGGVTLAAGGTALAISQAANAGKNWQDLSTGAKLGKTALVGLGSAAAGVGAVMLGASGPVGWAIAGTVALGSLAVGMSQVQDGIKSVKEEQEELAKAQKNAEIANSNYLTSLENLATTTANLEQIERETGESGKALAEQVKNGTLTVDKMTTSQLRCYNAYMQNEEMIKQNKKAVEEKTKADKQAVIESLQVEIANSKESGSYDNLKKHIIEAYEGGKLSAEECREITERAMGGMSEASRKTFVQDLPSDITNGLNPTRYASGWEKFRKNLSTVWENIWYDAKSAWERIENLFSGKGFKSNTELQIQQSNQRSQEAMNIGEEADRIANDPTLTTEQKSEKLNELRRRLKNLASYDVGTNYVPNDQLAIVHKGEAIVPAKYNNAKTFGGHDTYLRNTLDAMNSEIASLRSLISQGIPITGEFVQRGSDLYATVEKVKDKRGNQPLSNPSYAR